MDEPHVLDILAKKQGCFVSDLRLNPVNRRKALADLLLLEESAYRQKEWRETAGYLLGRNLSAQRIGGHQKPYIGRIEENAGIQIDRKKGRYTISLSFCTAYPKVSISIHRRRFRLV